MAVFLDSTNGTWQLPQGKSVLGRSSQCDIVLDDMRLSRQHADITLNGSELTVSDRGSANGVLVNHDRISSATTLRNGDLLITGPFAFRVRIIAEQDDPSRVKSESIVKPQTDKNPQQQTGGKGKRTSQEFMPSTDRATKNTVDMSTDDYTEDAPALEFSPGMAPPLQSTTSPSGNRRNISSDIQDAIRGDSGNRPNATNPPTPTGVDFTPKTDQKNRTEALLPDTVNKRTSNALERNDDESGSRPDTSRAMAPRRIPNSRPRGTTRAICSVCELFLFLVPASILGAATFLSAVSVARSRMEDGSVIDDLTHQTLSLNGAQVLDLLSMIKAEDPNTFTIMFIGAALALLMVILTFLFTLVTPLSMRGGSFVQRRMGLITLDHRGWYPSVWRSLWRGVWFLAIIPIELVASAMGSGGLHDRFAGCLLRNKEADEPIHG